MFPECLLFYLPDTVLSASHVLFCLGLVTISGIAKNIKKGEGENQSLKNEN